MTCGRWIAVAFAIGLAPAAPAARVGKPAPSFTLTTFDGEKVTRDTVRGKVVLINRWATWCTPCRAEMPLIDAYFRRHRAQGLAVFAVSGEDSVPKKALAPLAAVLSFPLSNRFSGAGYAPINNSIPTSYVIDRAGVVRYAQAGMFDAAALGALLGPLLAEPVPVPVPVAVSAPTP